MLAPTNRLRKPAQINRVYKRGAYGSAAGLFSLKAATSNELNSRAVVVVGKKVDKRAVVRNRQRRRLAAVLREAWGTVPGGYDIVISVHTLLNDVSSADLRLHLNQAMERAKVIKPQRTTT